MENADIHSQRNHNRHAENIHMSDEAIHDPAAISSSFDLPLFSRNVILSGVSAPLPLREAPGHAVEESLFDVTRVPPQPMLECLEFTTFAREIGSS